MTSYNIQSQEGMEQFNIFLSKNKNISGKDKKAYMHAYKKAFINKNDTQDGTATDVSGKKTNGGSKKKRLIDYKLANSKQCLSTMRGIDLKKILIQHNSNNNGSKKELVDRVWWLLHPYTEKPPKMEKGKRGRPGIPKLKNPAFIPDNDDDDDEMDDDNLQDLLLQYNITKPTWKKIYINSNKISTSGREFYIYKDTKYIFKETIDDGYIPYCYVNSNQTITKIDTSDPVLFPAELKVILRQSM